MGKDIQEINEFQEEPTEFQEEPVEFQEEPVEFQEEEVEYVNSLKTHQSSENQNHTHIHTHNHNYFANKTPDITNDIIEFMTASNPVNTFIGINADKNDAKKIIITIGEDALKKGFKIRKNSIVKNVAIGPIDKTVGLNIKATNFATRKLNESREKCNVLYDVYKINCDVSEYDMILGLNKKEKFAVLTLVNLTLEYENN